MVLVRKGFPVSEYQCLGQTFISVTIRCINRLLSGSFGMRYSDSYDQARRGSENSLRRDE